MNRQLNIHKRRKLPEVNLFHCSIWQFSRCFYTIRQQMSLPFVCTSPCWTKMEKGMNKKLSVKKKSQSLLAVEKYLKLTSNFNCFSKYLSWKSRNFSTSSPARSVWVSISFDVFSLPFASFSPSIDWFFIERFCIVLSFRERKKKCWKKLFTDTESKSDGSLLVQLRLCSENFSTLQCLLELSKLTPFTPCSRNPCLIA